MLPLEEFFSKIEGLAFTFREVQSTIWNLIDNTGYGHGSIDPWDVCLSQLLYDAAVRYGFGYKPGCGDQLVRVMVPCVSPSLQSTIDQVTILPGDPVYCPDVCPEPRTTCRNCETAWAFAPPINGSDVDCPAEPPYSKSFADKGGKSDPVSPHHPNCPMERDCGSEQWGWEIVISTGEYETDFELWAAAGNNNLGNGFRAATGKIKYLPMGGEGGKPAVKIAEVEVSYEDHLRTPSLFFSHLLFFQMTKFLTYFCVSVRAVYPRVVR